MERYPSHIFTLLLGSDTYIDLCKGKWKRGLLLFDLVDIIVVPRPGVLEPLSPYRGEGETGVRIESAKASLSQVSSTEIRNMIRDNVPLPAGYIQSNVLQYILDNKLYKE